MYKRQAPIYSLQADKVFITLAEGSENTLANGGEFVAIDENNIDGVIFSKTDLTLNGSGSLSIASPAGHGVVSKDDLVAVSYTHLLYRSGPGGKPGTFPLPHSAYHHSRGPGLCGGL